MLSSRQALRRITGAFLRCKGYSTLVNLDPPVEIRLNNPLSPNVMPRFGGIATMMRLPLQESDPEGLDVCFVGIPLDTGTSFRSGTRHGPRMIRHESSILNRYIHSTGAAPFESLKVADIGDVPVNPYNLPKSLNIITDFYRKILRAGCVPLGLGGDHTLTLGILRAVCEKYGPVGMIQIDAHTDTQDTMFGEKIAHGTPFRRAVEEGLIDPKYVVQIGLRGSGYGPDDYKWPKEQGFQMILAQDCWYKSLTPLMDSIKRRIGRDRPVYLTFDIDGIDPAFCPGTVRVNPLLDASGATALTGGNFLYEMLSILPGVKYYV